MHACLAALPFWGPPHGCLASTSSKLSASNFDMRGMRYKNVGRAIAMSWAQFSAQQARQSPFK